MKKFLTVLLALSVVFTYSFSAVGTAFAAAPATTSDVDTAISQMEDAIDAAYEAKFFYTTNGTINSVTGVDADDLDTNLTKTAIEKTIKALKEDLGEAIRKAYGDNSTADLTTVWTAVLGTTDLDTDSAPNLPAVIFATTVADNSPVQAYAAKDGILYTTAVEEAINSANAYMDTVDPSIYDGTAVKDAKTDLSKAITDAENSKSGLSTLLGKVAALKSEVANGVLKADVAADFEKYKTDAKKAVETAADTFLDNETARLQGIIADDSKSAAEVAEATAKLNSLASNVAALQKIYADQIDAVALADYDTTAAAKSAVDGIKTAGAAAFESTANFENKVGELNNTNALVQYAQGYAQGLESMYDKTTGKAVYNTATVEAALAEVVAEINNLKITDNAGIIAYFTANCPTAEAEKANLATFMTEAKKVFTTDSGSNDPALKALTGKYAPTNWNANAEAKAAVEEIQKEYETKVDAASTKEDIIALVKEAQAKIDAVALRDSDANDVKADILRNLKVLKYANAATGKGGTIESYANSKNINGQYSADILDGAIQQAADVLYDAVLDEKNTELTDAQIQNILKGKYAEALAKIDAMPTKDTLTSDANAVIEAIKALPTTVTLETKDQYLAVEKQYEDYLALAGAKYTDIKNQNLLDGYMTKLIDLEKADVVSKIAKLPATITVNDQAAVEAARDAYDAYKKAYAQYADATAANGLKYSYTDISNAYITKLDNAEGALSTAKLTDAAKKIAALPANVTEADKAAVEAARAAYDNLSDAEKLQISDALLEKLKGAEAQLADANVTAIKGTHMKIYSSAKKGYIKISWKASNTDVALDGVEVYRSTKKNSGFKKISTFKVQKSKKYTKNMKKGTKYYFYVKGYKMVGDEKVYTHDSIKVARTFRK